MNTTTLVWLIIFSLSALLFFSTAVFIMYRGAKDLADLLKNSRRKERDE
jgi:hypothetical protein